MDIWTIYAAILRRLWYFVLAVGVTMMIAIGVAASGSSTYRAEGSVLLLAPAGVDTETGVVFTNPYLSGGTVLRNAADVVTQVVTGPEGSAAVDASVPDASYQMTVGRDAATIAITAEADRAEDAIAAVEEVSALSRSSLDDLQAEVDVPEPARIIVDDLVAPTDADKLNTGRVRAFLLIVALGLAASVTFTVLVDRWLRGRPPVVAIGALSDDNGTGPAGHDQTEDGLGDDSDDLLVLAGHSENGHGSTSDLVEHR